MTEPIPTESGTSEANDAFYVGYLPAPKRYARFVRVILPVLLLAAVVVGVVVAAFHKDPGPGTWDTSRPRTFEGVVYVAPYAMIRAVDSAADGKVRTLLLVQEGKFGAIDRVKALDSRAARISGFIRERDGQWLVELESTDTAVAPLDSLPGELGSRLRRPEPKSLGPVTLRGEIIDPKCYFGAMKPGEGKQHKACATLCIAGGIPPMFKTTDPAGKTEYYLLTGRDGSAINEGVLPFVADAVEIQGALEKRDDLLILKIGPADIRRL